MARTTSSELTERESAIMEILWQDGPVASEHIRKKLPGNPHDSSVRTFLRILIDKGYVRSNSKQRPATFTAAVKRDRAQKRAVKNLLGRLFGGSAESLVLRLLEDDRLTMEQLEKIRQSVQTKTRRNIGGKHGDKE